MSNWWNDIDFGWRHSIRGSILIESGELDLEIALGISTDPVLKQKAKYCNEIASALEKDISNVSEASLDYIQNNIKELVAAREDIKDLNALRNIHNLKKLVIDNVKIDDLKPIYHLSSLRELQIKKSSISEDKLNDFRNIHPKCIVTR